MYHLLFLFFCTVHWADLSWPPFHYWLYPVWLCMWQINKNLEPWNKNLEPWTSFEFDFVWSTRYSRCILSLSLVLSCLVLIKDYYLSLRPRLRVLVPPCCVHRDNELGLWRKLRQVNDHKRQICLLHPVGSSGRLFLKPVSWAWSASYNLWPRKKKNWSLPVNAITLVNHSIRYRQKNIMHCNTQT